MNEKTLSFLKLMFNEGETICVSDSKFSTHSIPLENATNDNVTLVSPNPNVPIKIVGSDKLTMVALNPIKGFKKDDACYKFRNFLVELDYGNKAEQIKYLNTMGILYSAMVWSGSKSVHTLISLSEDLPNENIYRVFSKWILNIVSMADQNTFNPSRSIRIPGTIRPETGNMQELIEIKSRVNLKDLVAWLQKHPEARPTNGPLREKSDVTAFDKIRPWARKRLINGLDRRKGRSNQWFALAFEFCLSGYSLEDTITILGGFFTPDRDFKEKEWRTTIASAFKHVDKKTE
jgi:hypothetical protein